MKPKIISRKDQEDLGKQLGIPPMPRDHPVHLEGPSIVFSSQPQRTSKRTPHIPLSPIDLPSSADTSTSEYLSILDTPLESEPAFIEYDEVIPGVRVPKYLPRDSAFIAMVEWPLRPGDTRIEAYFIGTNCTRRHWFLMECIVDDLSPYETKYLTRRTTAMVKKGRLRVEEAAVLLLSCAWKYEKETLGTPAFFMVSDCGLLDLTTVNELADIVWPEQDSE
jgi:hypothetical protein